MMIQQQERKAWYNYYTKLKGIRDELRFFLKQHEFYYELSGSMNDWHFEILLDEIELHIVNTFLESLNIDI